MLAALLGRSPSRPAVKHLPSVQEGGFISLTGKQGDTDPTSSKWQKKKSLESLSLLIPACQWCQPRADTRELLEAAQSSFDVSAAAPCFDVSTELCLSEPSLMVKFHCLPGAISPLIPSLQPMSWFLGSSTFSELLLRSGSHCDSWKGASFSEPVVLFLSCFLLVARCSGGFIYHIPLGAAVWTVVPYAGWCQLMINGSHCCFHRKQWQPRGTICCRPQECKNNMSVLSTGNEDKPLEQAVLGEKKMLLPKICQHFFSHIGVH